MINDFDDLDGFDDISPSPPLDIENIKQNISNYSSEKLCEMIVCNRYFGCYKEIGIICMEELASRRISGDEYNFEEYIELSYSKLPELTTNIVPDLGDVLRKVLGRS